MALGLGLGFGMNVGRRSGIASDPYAANVRLLLNAGGTDGSTSIIDSAPSPHTMTAAGNAQIDTSLGYNTILFDGTGDRVTTPYVAGDFDWWTSDYTIEAWVNITTLADWYYADGPNKPAMIGCADPASLSNYWSFGPDFNNDVVFYYFNGGAVLKYHAGPATGVLSHVSMTHKLGTGIYLAANGNISTVTAVSGTPQSTSTAPVVLTIGQINNRSINGHIKAIRLTKGTARYQTNFTPPPAPFS